MIGLFSVWEIVRRGAQLGGPRCVRSDGRRGNAVSRYVGWAFGWRRVLRC
jgi:hypothetical protein